MNVLFTPKVLLYFEELTVILYDKEYFSLLEASKKYVDELVDDIAIYLPTRQHEPAPNYFDKYGKGMYYASFRKNKQTTWYAFFNKYKQNEDQLILSVVKSTT